MQRRLGAFLGILGLCLAPMPAPLHAAEVEEFLAAGREAFAARALGRQDIRAVAGPIDTAIESFEAALDLDPASFEARVALLKALFFKGEHVLTDRDAKLAVFERGRALAEEGIQILTRNTDLDPTGAKNRDSLVAHLGHEPDAVGVYFFAAVHWGLWGRYRGKIAAARKGVAGKIRDYAAVVLALDPDYESGGGHRILGRLHAEAPKLPFVTSWIDRDIAIRELELAHRADPEDALSLLYLAEALLEHDSSRRAEARTLLEKLVGKAPNPEYLVEELQAIADGREVLARIGS